jgi:hypothetical protein
MYRQSNGNNVPNIVMFVGQQRDAGDAIVDEVSKSKR